MKENIIQKQIKNNKFQKLSSDQFYNCWCLYTAQMGWMERLQNGSYDEGVKFFLTWVQKLKQSCFL